MDPFAILPTEIILLILESCCDFTSLNGLQQISPRVEQVFNTSYKTITEHVLKKCSLTSEGLHKQFALLASVEYTTFTPTTVLEQLYGLSGKAVRPVSISSINSLAAVRQAVETAAKVHIYACACLQHLLCRVESAKPRHPIASATDVLSWVRGSLPEPKSETFQMTVDPPSWIEYYRTHRGLWNLELFDHIYNAASTRWSWSTYDLENFVEQYVEWCQYMWGQEEVQAISECVYDLCPTEPTTLSHRFPFLIAVPSPADLTLRTCCHLPMAPTDTQVDTMWGRGRSTAQSKNNVLQYYNMLRGGQNGPLNPLLKLDFKAFRRVGIPLWDKWRMYQMGLMDQSRDVLSPEGNVVGGELDRIERPRLAESGDILEEFGK
ncbi:hypothetical protein N7475_005061 [Penicillium sp. IBT 31633x]|nr:hypothetical protein N7475_005061 [Penicillium sp. IBT 31633x]